MDRQGMMRLRVGEAPDQRLQPTAAGISVLHRPTPLPPPAAAELCRTATGGWTADGIADRPLPSLRGYLCWDRLRLEAFGSPAQCRRRPDASDHCRSLRSRPTSPCRVTPVVG